MIALPDDNRQALIERGSRIVSPAALALSASQGRWWLTPQAYVMDRAITAAIRRQIPHDIVVIDSPPQHGKSEYNSHWLPLWFLGSFPDRQVILTTYSGKRAMRWGQRARAAFRRIGPEYFDVGPCRDRRSGSDWGVADHMGGMISSGMGGQITGEGAHLFVVDDPVKNAAEAMSETLRKSHWEWFRSTALTRRREGAVVVVIMTRWHNEDLSGRILKWGREHPGRILHLRMPAIADSEDDVVGREIGEPLCPDLFPLHVLQERRLELGAYWWGAMYQGRPGAWGETEWGDDYFDGLIMSDGETWPDAFDVAVVALDPSKGKDARRGDYAALTFVGLHGGMLYVDVNIARRDVTNLCRVAVEFAQRHRAASYFGLESNAFQDLLAGPLDEACKDAGVPPLPIFTIHNSVNKEVRIRRVGPWLARRKIRLRPSVSADLLVQQLKDFPVGQHDDGPDSLEMALRLIRWAVDQPAEVP